MLLPVLFMPMIMLVISLVKLCIICFSVVETLVIATGGSSGLICPRSSELIQLVIKPIYCMGMAGFGYQQLSYIMC